MKRLAPLCACFAAVWFCAGALADITSSFQSGAQGWTAVDCNCGGNYATPIQPNPSNWEGGPGASGAAEFLRTVDPFNNCVFFNAPSAYLGDQSQHVGGVLRFWIRTNTTSWQNDDVIVLVSTGAPVLVRAIGVPQQLNQWVQYTVPLSTATPGWRVGNKSGVQATPAQFAAAM